LTYNLHLESRGNDQLRLSQLEEVVTDAAPEDQQNAMIIAGDFNVDVGASKGIALLAHAGFHDAVAATRTATTPSRSLFEPAPDRLGLCAPYRPALAVCTAR
jgi:endonuclease/exonuclease/phosphatase family metal-dependent hydrolase